MSGRCVTQGTSTTSCTLIWLAPLLLRDLVLSPAIPSSPPPPSPSPPSHLPRVSFFSLLKLLLPFPFSSLLFTIPLPTITLLPFPLFSLLSISFFYAFVSLDSVLSSSTWAFTVVCHGLFVPLLSSQGPGELVLGLRSGCLSFCARCKRRGFSLGATACNRDRTRVPKDCWSYKHIFSSFLAKSDVLDV